jgi:hypothetical protein
LIITNPVKNLSRPPLRGGIKFRAKYSVVKTDMRFGKEDNTKEQSKYLQTCIAAVHT